MHYSLFAEKIEQNYGNFYRFINKISPYQKCTNYYKVKHLENHKSERLQFFYVCHFSNGTPCKKVKFVQRDCLYFKHCMNCHYHVNPKILKILSPEFRVILNRYPESLTIEIEVEKNFNIWKLLGGFSSMEIWHALQTHKIKIICSKMGFLCVFITLYMVNPKS